MSVHCGGEEGEMQKGRCFVSASSVVDRRSILIRMKRNDYE